MRWIDGLNKSQRVVVVIALGLALGVVGSYVTTLGSLPVGWYAYSPLTMAPYRSGLNGWLRVIIWLVLIGLWAAASIRLLRQESGNAAGHPDND